jgi:chemotaxis protein methyltransferase CheR
MNVRGEGLIPPISDKEFALFQSLIHQETGIYLSPVKKGLLAGRLTRRLRELGLDSFGAYYRRVAEGGEEERTRLFNAISTNETHFFREPKQFQFLQEQILPEWSAQAAAGVRPKAIRAWSAGCSTGEEPYSLAMVLLDFFPPPAGWSIEILATDLSTRVLARARAAVWPVEKAKEIPPRYLKAFMLKGVRTEEGKMKAGPEIASVVRFERLNLNDPAYPVTGLFDLIFCRNVLIYFNTGSKARVVDRLLDHLSPNGYFFLGHAESLHGLSDRARTLGPTIYRLRSERIVHRST